MSKILVSGCLGAMGSTVVQAVRKENGCTLAGGFDLASSKQSDFPIFASPADCAGVDFDVVIDFSSPRTLPALEEIARRKGCGLVLATTGYTEEQLVSSDVVGMTYGSLFDATQTMVSKIDDDTYQVQVVSWYDNENSYTSQMVRTIKYFAELQ